MHGDAATQVHLVDVDAAGGAAVLGVQDADARLHVDGAATAHLQGVDPDPLRGGHAARRRQGDLPGGGHVGAARDRPAVGRQVHVPGAVDLADDVDAPAGHDRQVAAVQRRDAHGQAVLLDDRDVLAGAGLGEVEAARPRVEGGVVACQDGERAGHGVAHGHARGGGQPQRVCRQGAAGRDAGLRADGQRARRQGALDVDPGPGGEDDPPLGAHVERRLHRQRSAHGQTDEQARPQAQGDHGQVAAHHQAQVIGVVWRVEHVVTVDVGRRHGEGVAQVAADVGDLQLGADPHLSVADHAQHGDGARAALRQVDAERRDVDLGVVDASVGLADRPLRIQNHRGDGLVGADADGRLDEVHEDVARGGQADVLAGPIRQGVDVDGGDAAPGVDGDRASGGRRGQRHGVGLVHVDVARTRDRRGQGVGLRVQGQAAAGPHVEIVGGEPGVAVSAELLGTQLHAAGGGDGAGAHGQAPAAAQRDVGRRIACRTTHETVNRQGTVDVDVDVAQGAQVDGGGGQVRRADVDEAGVLRDRGRRVGSLVVDRRHHRAEAAGDDDDLVDGPAGADDVSAHEHVSIGEQLEAVAGGQRAGEGDRPAVLEHDGVSRDRRRQVEGEGAARPVLDQPRALEEGVGDQLATGHQGDAAVALDGGGLPAAGVQDLEVVGLADEAHDAVDARSDGLRDGHAVLSLDGHRAGRGLRQGHFEARRLLARAIALEKLDVPRRGGGGQLVGGDLQSRDAGGGLQRQLVRHEVDPGVGAELADLPAAGQGGVAVGGDAGLGAQGWSRDVVRIAVVGPHPGGTDADVTPRVHDDVVGVAVRQQLQLDQVDGAGGVVQGEAAVGDRRPVDPHPARAGLRDGHVTGDLGADGEGAGLGLQAHAARHVDGQHVGGHRRAAAGDRGLRQGPLDPQLDIAGAARRQALHAEIRRVPGHGERRQRDVVVLRRAAGGHVDRRDRAEGRHRDGAVGGAQSAQADVAAVGDLEVPGPGHLGVHGRHQRVGCHTVGGAGRQLVGAQQAVPVGHRAARGGQAHVRAGGQGRLPQADVAALAARAQQDVARRRLQVRADVGTDAAGASGALAGLHVDEAVGQQVSRQVDVVVAGDLDLCGGQQAAAEAQRLAGADADVPGRAVAAVGGPVADEGGVRQGDGAGGMDADVTGGQQLGGGGDGVGIRRPGGRAALDHHVSLGVEAHRARRRLGDGAHMDIAARRDLEAARGQDRLLVEGAVGPVHRVVEDALRREDRLLFGVGHGLVEDDRLLLHHLGVLVDRLEPRPPVPEVVALARPREALLQAVLVVDVARVRGPVVVEILVGLEDVAIVDDDPEEAADEPLSPVGADGDVELAGTRAVAVSGG